MAAVERLCRRLNLPSLSSKLDTDPPTHKQTLNETSLGQFFSMPDTDGLFQLEQARLKLRALTQPPLTVYNNARFHDASEAGRDWLACMFQ